MTRLLASVANLGEVDEALACGADLVDCKDPTRGALGAWAPELVAAAVERTAGRAPVSATVGDLPLQRDAVFAAACGMARSGVDFVKIGLFPGDDPGAVFSGLADAAGRAGLVAVLFADRNPDFALLPVLARAKFAGVMLDTADKESGPLTRHLSTERLAEFVAGARRLGLLCGLAGSLRPADVPALLPLRPDYLGFRGALCRDGRVGRLDRRRAARLCRLLRGIPA